MSKSAVLTNYQFDLVSKKVEAIKFLKIVEKEAGDIIDDHNKAAWLLTALDELYAEFLKGKKIRRRDLESLRPISSAL